MNDLSLKKSLLGPNFYAVLFFLASIFLMQSSVRVHSPGDFLRTLTSPFQSAFQWIRGEVVSFIDNYLWLIDVAKERDELMVKVKELELSLSQMQEISSENERVRSLLALKVPQDWQKIGARITSYRNDPWKRQVTIDVGIEDGVMLEAAVVRGGNVVGFVSHIASRHSIVQLINDPLTAIDAIIASSRHRGICTGNENGMLNLEYVHKNEGIRVGEEILTFGKDGIFPKGLKIGTVQHSLRNQDSLFQDISVKPAVDFHQLEEIVVLINRNSLKE